MEKEENETIQHQLANVNISLLQELYNYCLESCDVKDNSYRIKFLSTLQNQLMKLKEEKTKAIKKEYGVTDRRQVYFRYCY